MKRIFFWLLILISQMVSAQLKEIQLYEGPAPGSENWTWKEGMNNKNSLKVMTVYNVVRPSLTFFAPEPSVAKGTAIIIAPGGGFHFLAIDHEGSNAARILAKRGIAVFVLKYRTFHISSDNPFDDMLHSKDPKAWDDEALPVIPLAIADGKEAIDYVRRNAAAYKINPTRIGIMGFSAGGLIAAAAAFDYNSDNRPDFVAPIYADIPERIQSNVLSDAPPLFLACAQDDEFGFATHAISMYTKWYEVKRPVEMILFARGGHGFGVGNAANTTHHWLDRFVEWLIVQGMMDAK
jgi:acetyl esterase/lipase